MPNRELANIIPSDIFTTHHHQIDTHCIPENINMNFLRGRFNNLSTINFKDFLTHLDTSLVLYNIRMELQSKDPAWANQMEDLNNIQLFYADSFNIEGPSNCNQASQNNTINMSHMEGICNYNFNTCPLQGIETSSIQYRDN